MPVHAKVCSKAQCKPNERTSTSTVANLTVARTLTQVSGKELPVNVGTRCPTRSCNLIP